MSDLNASKNLEPKSKHSLSSIDQESRTAICAVCGPTHVHRVKIRKIYTAYVCATRSRQRSEAYRLANPHIPHPQQLDPTAHVLSNVDDENKTAICLQGGPVKIYIRRSKNLLTRVCKNASNKRSRTAEKKRQEENREFVESYKVSHGCKNCGYSEDSKTLEFHAPGRDRRTDRIGKLLRLKQERLLQELEKYEILCKNCHDKAHPKLLSKPRRKHNPLPFMTHTK